MYEGIELRVPVEATLIINSLGGLMEKLDGRKQNKGKKGRKMTTPVKVELKAGPDNYVPGHKFTIAKSVRGKWAVKPLKVDGVCVTKGCINKTKDNRSKWCESCFPKVRAIAMQVNKKRWLKKHAA